MSELTQIGVLGLVEAARAHGDDSAPADGFAIRRIQGAILDFLRSQDVLTRTQRRALRQVEMARRRAAQKLVREPRESEVARHAGITFEEYARIVSEGAIVRRTVNTERLSSGGLDPSTLLEQLQDHRGLTSALQILDERLRGLIVSHYVEGVPFEEISRRLGVSSGRISQLHRRALERLRSALTLLSHEEPNT